MFHRDPMEGAYPEASDASEREDVAVCEERLPGCTEFATVFTTDADGLHSRCVSCQRASTLARQRASVARVGQR